MFRTYDLPKTSYKLFRLLTLHLRTTGSTRWKTKLPSESPIGNETSQTASRLVRSSNELTASKLVTQREPLEPPSKARKKGRKKTRTRAHQELSGTNKASLNAFVEGFIATPTASTLLRHDDRTDGSLIRRFRRKLRKP